MVFGGSFNAEGHGRGSNITARVEGGGNGTANEPGNRGRFLATRERGFCPASDAWDFGKNDILGFSKP
jgi:hypothetical protein